MITPHSVSSEHYAVKYFLCELITLVSVLVHIKDDLSHSGMSDLNSGKNSTEFKSLLSDSTNMLIHTKKD